jgi:hypothetical protein
VFRTLDKLRKKKNSTKNSSQEDKPANKQTTENSTSVLKLTLKAQLPDRFPQALIRQPCLGRCTRLRAAQLLEACKTQKSFLGFTEQHGAPSAPAHGPLQAGVAVFQDVAALYR